MKDRTTQVLLGVIALLLATNLFRSSEPPVRAADPNEPSTVLRAEAIELVNKRGDVVAQLHVGIDGGGNLRLRSGDGMVRVKLGATKDGAGMHLFDATAEPAVSLASSEAGTSVTLAQHGKDKKIIQP